MKALLALLLPLTAPQDDPPVRAGSGAGDESRGIRVEDVGPDTTIFKTEGRAGTKVITARDLDVEWEFHRSTDATLGARPTSRERVDLLRSVIAEHLWIQRARVFPRYPEVVTPKMIARRAKSYYPDLWEDPELDPERRAILERKVEATIAKEALREVIPRLSRNLEVLPEQMRSFYRSFPKLFEVEETVLLSRVILTRGLRADAGELAAQIREEAQQDGLEAAADRLAKDSFKMLDWEAQSELEEKYREEILRFVASAEIGEISPVFDRSSSVSIYELVDRREGRTVPFAEAAANIRRLILKERIEAVMNDFFINDILPMSEFEPQGLFDDLREG